MVADPASPTTSPTGHQARRTHLFPLHQALGARMVLFAGWEMPLWYRGIVEEHRAVRTQAGVFDVSHMGRFEVSGIGALGLLQEAVTGNVGRLEPGRALYTLLCRDDGGILDDLIVYCLAWGRYLLVVNAANREKDWGWLEEMASGFAAVMVDRSEELGMIALQGPQSFAVLAEIMGSAASEGQPRFTVRSLEGDGETVLVARTGYTGEDGFEVMAPRAVIARLWKAMIEGGVPPCGLGARDTLRLEAALPLHGHDIDESTNPLESGLGRCVDLEKRSFRGQKALQQIQQQGLARRLIGLRMKGREIPRQGCPLLHQGKTVGTVTSGGYAPTLGMGIALGYVPLALAEPGTPLEVAIRGKTCLGEGVALPFYRRARLSALRT